MSILQTELRGRWGSGPAKPVGGEPFVVPNSATGYSGHWAQWPPYPVVTVPLSHSPTVLCSLHDSRNHRSIGVDINAGAEEDAPGTCAVSREFLAVSVKICAGLGPDAVGREPERGRP